MPRDRLIRDPVYGYVSLPHELAPVVDHPLVQRLRRVAQTSLTSSVYPSATGSRFEHALGAMHLARRGWRAAWQNGGGARADLVAAVGATVPTALSDGDSERLAERLGLAVACVALLHDVGHPPFSHVLEDEFAALTPEFLANRFEELAEFGRLRTQFHEFAGVLLTRELIKQLPSEISLLTRQIYESDPDLGTWAGALHSIVAGEIDVDRLDYLMRDAQKAGTEFGGIDYERLIDALELHAHDGSFRIAPGVRARSAVETLLVQRSQSYRWITFHPRVISTNAALGRALSLALKLRFDASAVSTPNGEHPLASFVDEALPVLNYLAPTIEDLQRASGIKLAESSQGQGQIELTEQAHTEALQRLSVSVQAGVDDATVVQFLKRVSLLAAQVLPQLHEPTRGDALELITFANASLFREKNAITAWKTADEYQAAVTKTPGFISDLSDVVGDVHSELRDRCAGNKELETAFETRRTRLQADLERDPLTAVNDVFHDVFTSSEVRVQLEKRLNAEAPQLKKVPGRWVVVYTKFNPVRTDGQLSVLYRGEEPIELRSTSRVLGGLEAIEVTRPRLELCFFLTYPLSADPWGPAESLEARQMLTGRAFGIVPGFLREVWADHVAQRFGLPS